MAGNHVELIEGQQVRGRTLDRYLTALLRRAEEFEPGQAVILNGKFTSGDGKELSESSEITIAAVPNAGVEGIRPGAAQRAAEIVENEVARAREEGATVFDVLARSEEHTSELQSLMRISYAAFCLKKKKK